MDTHKKDTFDRKQNMNKTFQNPYMQNSNPNVNNQSYTNPYLNSQNLTQNTQLFSHPKSGFNIFGDTASDKFLRGLIVGGIGAYILTNESAQKAIIKAGVKIFESIGGGIEEFKEKIMDAKAELDAQNID